MKTDDYKEKYEDALARLSDVVQERSELRQINAELVAVLEPFSKLDMTVNGVLWAIRPELCKSARTAIAKSTYADPYLEIAAQAWGTISTSAIEMNPDLCAAFANILQREIEKSALAPKAPFIGAAGDEVAWMCKDINNGDMWFCHSHAEAPSDGRYTVTPLYAAPAALPDGNHAIREFIRISVIGRGDVPDDIRKGAITVLAAECREDK